MSSRPRFVPPHLDDILGDNGLRIGPVMRRVNSVAIPRIQIDFAATSEQYGRGVSRHRQRAARAPNAARLQRDKLTEMIMSMISSAPTALKGRVGQSWAGRVSATLKRRCVAYIVWCIEQAGAIAISRAFGLLAGQSPVL